MIFFIKMLQHLQIRPRRKKLSQYATDQRNKRKVRNSTNSAFVIITFDPSFSKKYIIIIIIIMILFKTDYDPLLTCFFKTILYWSLLLFSLGKPVFYFFLIVFLNFRRFFKIFLFFRSIAE
jgi:hypothetical protein